MAIDASSELLIGQWLDSPKLRAAVDAPIDLANEDVIPAFEAIHRMHDIDHAVGVWLDFLGVRVGLRRPTVRDSGMEERFGFDMAGEPFDHAPFRGEAANDAVYPLPDVIYRRFIRARATLVVGDGTFATLSKAVRQIDPAATVIDRRDMTIRVVTSERALLELADASGALPRSGGVTLEYRDRGRFGYDQSGVGYDQGPFV